MNNGSVDSTSSAENSAVSTEGPQPAQIGPTMASAEEAAVIAMELQMSITTLALAGAHAPATNRPV